MIDAATTANFMLQNIDHKMSKTISGAQIDGAAQDFESLFISQMLEQMFGDSIGDDAFGDSETSEVYKGLMVQEYGKLIAKSGGIGVAPYVKNELLKLQEVKS